MLIKKELPDGKIEVSSDIGMVDIGCGPVKAIIVSKDEVDLVSETSGAV